MIIGITGSIASGKSTALKVLSRKKYPAFSADLEVKKLYSSRSFIDKICKKFNIKKDNNLKNEIKSAILKKPRLIKTLEKIIHPHVRKKMMKFINKNSSKQFAFLEIPLLLESKLSRHFDLVICITSSKNLRLKRYKKVGGDIKLFKIFDSKQIKKNKKTNFCDINIVNNKNFIVFKKKLNDVLSNINE